MGKGPETDPDLELVQAVGRGEAGAMERLMGRYQTRLHRFVYRYLADGEAARDLTQETFLRVWRAAPRFVPQAKVATWIYGIAYRLALSELQRRGRWTAFTQRWREMLPLKTTATPWDALQQNQAARRMEEALGRLPPRQKAALLLRVDQELSYAQIAQVMGVGVASVESLIHRARSFLRRSVPDREDSP